MWFNERFNIVVQSFRNKDYKFRDVIEPNVGTTFILERRQTLRQLES